MYTCISKLPLTLSGFSFIFCESFFRTEYPYQKESFSVGLNHHFQTSQGEIVRYNNIIENSTANVFNTQTGKFTAAMDGTYIFHYHGLAQNDEVGLYKFYVQYF